MVDVTASCRVLHDVDRFLAGEHGIHRRTGSLRDRQKQCEHFNRSLSQLTPGWRCAELYYLRNGEYVPNPHVPLQCTQANLVVAIREMRATLA